MTLTMRFYVPVPASSMYNASLSVYSGDCSDGTAQGARVSGFTPVEDNSYASLSVSSYTGSMDATRSFSSDRRELTISATLTLANRDYRWVSAGTSYP